MGTMPARKITWILFKGGECEYAKRAFHWYNPSNVKLAAAHYHQTNVKEPESVNVFVYRNGKEVSAPIWKLLYVPPSAETITYLGQIFL